MSRKPIYHEENKRLRIVSVNNEQWQAQKKVGEGGSKDSDAWTPLGRPTSKALAEAQMNGASKAT